jgi:hypothetical protein
MDPNGVTQAFRLFLNAANNGEIDPTIDTYRYDLIDLARQVICNIFSDVSIIAGKEYQRFQFNNINP